MFPLCLSVKREQEPEGRNPPPRRDPTNRRIIIEDGAGDVILSSAASVLKVTSPLTAKVDATRRHDERPIHSSLSSMRPSRRIGGAIKDISNGLHRERMRSSNVQGQISNIRFIAQG